MRRNKYLAWAVCAAVVFAGASLCARPVTAAGAEVRAAEQPLTAGSENAGTDAQDGSGRQDGSGAGAAATGTTVLLGAGVYTAMRKQWNEKKQEKPKEYVYFENHTKNGTLRDDEKPANWE